MMKMIKKLINKLRRPSYMFMFEKIDSKEIENFKKALKNEPVGKLDEVVYTGKIKIKRIK